MNTEKLKYPIGKFNEPTNITSKEVKKWINIIKTFPDKLKTEIATLSTVELNYKYRPDGWNIKQIVGHCLDSHTNSIIRFKLALTEENPLIRPYNESEWAKLVDTLFYDIQENLELLSLTHKRWIFLLESLTDKQLNRTFIHPDGNEIVTLKLNIAIYAWHCEHHLQHVINAKHLNINRQTPNLI